MLKKIYGKLREYAIKCYIPMPWGSEEWSIGIYKGKSPIKLDSNSIKNPLITRHDITDVNAEFVADPFMIQKDGTWYMFFEIMNYSNKGVIGMATSKDALKWSYKKVVLEEKFHLSYPYVFLWEGIYYMIPECCQSGSVNMYMSKNFPYDWVLVKKLIIGNYVDSSIFRYKKLWWLFTSDEDTHSLLLFYSTSLMGSWKSHKLNPIVKNDISKYRCAGRVIIDNGKILRFSQESVKDYGEESMPDTKYVITKSGIGWNKTGMHNIDAHKTKDGWIACVDGYKWHIIISNKK